MLAARDVLAVCRSVTDNIHIAGSIPGKWSDMLALDQM
jgi:hypothetical protein